MANFELIGFIKNNMSIGGRSRVTIAEYVQGKRDEHGDIVDEKMDSWYVFFPKSSRRHLIRFKNGDLVIVKGTIHQSPAGSDYAYAVNGESIKHFYTRNMLDEIKRESLNNNNESPSLEEYMNDDF